MSQSPHPSVYAVIAAITDAITEMYPSRRCLDDIARSMLWFDLLRRSEELIRDMPVDGADRARLGEQRAAVELAREVLVDRSENHIIELTRLAELLDALGSRHTHALPVNLASLSVPAAAVGLNAHPDDQVSQAQHDADRPHEVAAR